MTARALLLLALLALPGCPTASAPAAEEPIESPTISVSAATARDGRIVDPVTVTGVVGPRREVVVMAEGSGRVTQLPARLGDRVSSGDVLARLAADVPEARLDQALAQAAQAAAALELAVSDNERAHSLHVQGASTDRDLVASDISVRTARAQLQASDAAVKLARRGVADTTLRAPFDGSISSVSIELGAVIAPGTPAFGLVDLSEAVVSAGVSGREVSLVEPGQPVLVRVPSLGERAFEGTVGAVSPSSDPRTRTWGVEVRIPNDDRALRGGMVARVEIVVGERTGVLVPDGAVVEGTDGPRAYVLVDGLAQVRDLSLGRSTDGLVEVRSGIEAGEQVAVLGSQRLSDGAPVSIYALGGPPSEDTPSLAPAP